MDRSVDDEKFEVLNRALALFDFLAEVDVASAAARRTLVDGSVGLRGNSPVASANAGVAALISGDETMAREMFERAANTMRDHGAGSNGVALRGTSSGYHFRLAAHHGDAFEKASAARSKDLHVLMSAIVAHHLALLDEPAGAQSDVLYNAIDHVFGEASVEALVCRAETLSALAGCYAVRANKLRKLLVHWPARARLTPELEIAALAILPFDPRRLSPNGPAHAAFTRDTL